MGLSTFCERSHPHRQRVKIWIGGALSAGIIVFLGFAYAFSSVYYERYPIEKVGSSSWFGCDHDMRNAKFSSSLQMTQLIRFTDDNWIIYNMLDQQPFTLIIDLINTAFTCNDSIIVHLIVHEVSHNGKSVELLSKCNIDV
ncbi:unnamed protein product [Rotaria sordida]|uniref:Uncharacterized protein n=1 Tax=Rotaria sordida TaxID=392033 RepID=A0A818G6J6_9BILA|nr:unnamed protein product [Rotaria sordida]